MTNEHEPLSEAELAKNKRLAEGGHHVYKHEDILRLIAEVEKSRPIVVKYFANAAEVRRLQLGVARDAYAMKHGHLPPDDWSPGHD